MPEREAKPFLKIALADVPALPLAARRGTRGLPSHKKEGIDDDLVGGVSMLSGYLNKVRAEDPEALYVIAGDMFRGSIIDAEYQGVSTIEIMNYLAPDVVTLGNHEVDYGMAHLLFLEKCCKFPIVNANLYIKTTGMRIFNSHKVLRAAGSADQRKNLPARAGKFRLRHRGGVPPAAQSLDEPCRGQAGGPEWTEWIPE